MGDLGGNSLGVEIRLVDIGHRLIAVDHLP
jgi:hypothetical protein